jgi:hypothetical protein
MKHASPLCVHFMHFGQRMHENWNTCTQSLSAYIDTAIFAFFMWYEVLLLFSRPVPIWSIHFRGFRTVIHSFQKNTAITYLLLLSPVNHNFAEILTSNIVFASFVGQTNLQKESQNILYRYIPHKQIVFKRSCFTYRIMFWHKNSHFLTRNAISNETFHTWFHFLFDLHYCSVRSKTNRCEKSITGISTTAKQNNPTILIYFMPYKLHSYESVA